MKILLLSDANSIHTFRWAKSLKSKNFDIHIFSIFSPNNFSIDNYNKLNIKITSVGLEAKIKELRKPNLSKINYIRSLPFFKRTLNEVKPDLVHAHYASSYGLIGFLSGFKPFIISVWGSDIYHFPFTSFIAKLLLKIVLKGSNEICSTSYEMKKITENICYRNDIKVIPFGIDTKFFKPINKLQEKFTVGTIKSIEDHNGIDCLLDSASIVLNKYKKDINFLIVGDGSLKSYMEKKAIDLGIEKRVRFTGHIPHEEIIKYYNMLSIFIAVSTRESFGVSILEAGACGIPSITSNIGGLKEVNKNNHTGKIIAPDDAKILAKEIVNLYENEKLRKKLGENARRRVKKKFEWNENVNQMIKLYLKYSKSTNV